MPYIVLSICCSLIVSIMLKLAKRYHVDVYQAIVWNYSMAILLSWFFLKPHLSNFNSAEVLNYSLLGLLLPGIFVVLGISIKLSGIVRTDVAQRMSLLIPLVAAFLLFDEKFNTLRFIGIALGFVGIICTIPWHKKVGKQTVAPNSWIWLLIVFAGFGIIDVLFKQIVKNTPKAYNPALFIVFVLAFIFSFAGLVFQVATKKMRFSWPHILIGWGLGIVNFGNILFFMKALKVMATHPTTVYTAMDIGVMVAGALTGLIVFREKLSLLNKAGLVVAIIAVIIIAKS
jgi:drug/metabolite transporter (DMT)-like permease